MRQLMICFLFFFSFLSLSPLLPLRGEVSSLSTQNELKMIEEKINLLKLQLNANQKEEMKKEVVGQELMIADWSPYAQDLESIQKLESQNNQIRDELKALEERKRQLIDQGSDS